MGRIPGCGWETSWIATPEGIARDMQVIPLNDLYEHRLSIGCWCHPTHNAYDVLIRNSADGRERHETGTRLH